MTASTKPAADREAKRYQRVLAKRERRKKAGKPARGHARRQRRFGMTKQS